MLPDRVSNWLLDMLGHAREAQGLVAARTRADLDRDRLFNLALVRLLEIVGEAASQVPSEFRREHPEIPWPSIIAFRNRVIHGYFSVDFDILWGIANDDLPPLIQALGQILGGQAADGPSDGQEEGRSA